MKRACFGLLLFGFAASAMSACPGFEPDWLQNYDGDIGAKYRVRMTLTSGRDGVDGIYFYAKHLEDIRVRGRILDTTRIVLDELDAKGAVAARFEGEFVQKDPKGKYTGNDLQCEVIVGSWRKVDSEKRLPIYLSLTNATSGALEHRYALIGVQDDEIVHRNARRFVEAVKVRDKATVASLIAYPIKVSLKGDEVRILGPEQLVAHYDSIFTAQRRAAISRDLPRSMFVRYDGISLGASGVWFNAEGKVFSL